MTIYRTVPLAVHQPAAADFHRAVETCLRYAREAGARSLHWIVCPRCQHLAPALLDAMQGHGDGPVPAGATERCRLLAGPETSDSTLERFVERTRADVAVMPQAPHHCFLVVNRRVTLDLTPCAMGTGGAQLIEDRTVASLYVALFDHLATIARRTATLRRLGAPWGVDPSPAR